MHHIEAGRDHSFPEEREVSFDDEPGPHSVSSGPDHGIHPHVPGPLSTIKQAQENKHHRQMSRTIRHPVHHNSHRITF